MHRQLTSPPLTHWAGLHSSSSPLQSRQDCLQNCPAKYFPQPHQTLPLTVIFKSPQTWINVLPTRCTYSQLNLPSTKANTSKYEQELELKVTQVEVVAHRRILSLLYLLTKSFLHPFLWFKLMIKLLNHARNPLCQLKVQISPNGSQTAQLSL